MRGFIGDDTDYLFFPDDQQIRFALKNPRHPRQEAEKCGSGRETGGESFCRFTGRPNGCRSGTRLTHALVSSAEAKNNQKISLPVFQSSRRPWPDSCIRHWQKYHIRALKVDAVQEVKVLQHPSTNSHLRGRSKHFPCRGLPRVGPQSWAASSAATAAEPRPF